MTKTLEEIQRSLEEDSVKLGVARYQAIAAREDLANLPVGQQLLKVTIAPMSDAIKAWVDKAAHGRAMMNATTVDMLGRLEPDASAFLTLRTVFNCVTKRMRYQAVALAVANAICDQIEHDKFKGAKPALYNKVWRDVLKRARAESRFARVVIMRSKTKAGIETEEYTVKEKLKLGVVLIDLVMQATGLVELMRTAVRGKKEIYIQGTDLAAEWVNKRHALSELMHPVYLPMVVPPRDWTNPFDGGYLTLRKNPLIRTRNKHYLRELRQTDMPEVYAAINALQQTRWAVNPAVLEVAMQVWQSGGVTGGLPDVNPKPEPAQSGLVAAAFKLDKAQRTKEQQDAVKAWKQEAHDVYEHNVRERSARLAVATKLKLATDFEKYSAIYFPHNMDWRGRAYPIPAMLNPQGDDLARGLLHFADAKPLGPNGAYWLAVHGAGLFGVDKVDFDERVRWVQENTNAICESALFPLDHGDFWTKADKPYQALAFCFEWLGYTMQGENHVSRLPIAFDGSCNGLQNFSAMLRDPIGGAAVNLLPAAKPQDVYARVAEVATKVVEQDAAAGNEIAARWIGHVTRKIVKRNVMTLPYGCKRYGMKGQIEEELKKGTEDVEGPAWEAALYLSDVTYNATGTVVVAARRAMDWLQDVARIVARDDMPVRWTTPVGLPVLQAYRKSVTEEVNTFVGGVRYKLGVHADTDTIDRRRQAQGIAPNFVHSMDAAHMMKTVVRCLEHGVQHFAMIHDSYAVHAADADVLAVELREAFVDIYSNDVLGHFVEELKSVLPPGLAEELPPPPPKGDLDVNAVRQAQYFFA